MHCCLFWIFFNERLKTEKLNLISSYDNYDYVFRPKPRWIEYPVSKKLEISPNFIPQKEYVSQSGNFKFVACAFYVFTDCNGYLAVLPTPFHCKKKTLVRHVKNASLYQSQMHCDMYFWTSPTALWEIGKYCTLSVYFSCNFD